MAITLVQSTTGTTANYASTTLAHVSNVVSGNLLICTGAVWNGTSTTAVVVTDSVGTSYTTILGAVCAGTPNKSWIAYGMAAASGANTVTIDPDVAGAYSSHTVAEFSGVDATPLDIDGGNATGASTTASDDVTTIAADTVVIGVMSQGSGGNHALTEDTAGGWTLLGENENASNAPVASAYQIFTSAGAKTASWTIAASVGWCAQTASFEGSVAVGLPIGQTMAIGFHPGRGTTTAGMFFQSEKGYTPAAAPPVTVVFRKTLSPFGSRTGSRQIHNS